MRARGLLGVGIIAGVIAACGGRTSEVDRPPVVSLSSNASQTCVAKRDGTVSCWGTLDSSIASAGSARAKVVPEAIEGVTDAVQVACGAGHACARTRTGTVRCWGRNDEGQLGDGSNVHAKCKDDGQDYDCSASPVDVAGLRDVKTIAAGGLATCALRGDGHVACWGGNGTGQLGDGTTDDRNTPIDVVDLADAVDISVGEFHACAVRSNGSTWCWGDAFAGALGSRTLAAGMCGSRTCSSRPVQIRGIDDATSVSAGRHVACVRRRSGEVACWGEYVGGPTRDDIDGAVVVSAVFGGSAVFAGYISSCAVAADGGTLCWARNTSPAPVTGLPHGVVTIAGGWYHACALVEDGRVLCWGENQFGQIGDGTFEPREIPTEPRDL